MKSDATMPGNVCKDCGYPIVDVLCNHPFSEYSDAKNFDYWVYCSNKSCKNHDGAGYYSCSDFPEFVKGI